MRRKKEYVRNIHIISFIHKIIREKLLRILYL